MRHKTIDMWKLDPNWKFARQHGQASKTGIQKSGSPTGRNNSILMCPCCLKVIHKQPISLCQNPKQLSFLGYGFPLFYNMLQYCLVSLFILIISESSIFALFFPETNNPVVQSSDPVDYNYPCTSFFTKISRVPTDTSQFQVDRIIRGLSFIGQAFFMIYLRDVQRKLSAYHHQRNTRIKDFSVIFKNLPKITGIQKTIKEFLFGLDQLKIEEIFLMPKIDYFHELQQQKKEIIGLLKRIMKKEDFNLSYKRSLQAQLQRVNLQLIQTCKKTEELFQKDDLFSQKAIVILESKQQKKAVLNKFMKTTLKDKQKYFFWMAHEVTLQSAPQPREIIWAHINYPKYKHRLRVVLGWTLSILFLGAATVVFYFLVAFKSESHSMAVLIITLILIQFFNKYIMKIFLHWFSDIQMPQTSSQRQFSYTCKYSFGMFFTTAIMSLLVEGVIHDNIQFQFGVVESETIMFIFNAFIVNLLWILHPQYYIRMLQKWYYYGKKNITQNQANKLMQDYPYDMGKRYAEILQTMWFTFLYASLIPIGSFLSFIGLCIYYWVDKYNLLRRSKVQNIIQSKLPLKAVKLMQLTLFWKPLGQLVFDYRLRNILQYYEGKYQLLTGKYTNYSTQVPNMPQKLPIQSQLSPKLNLKHTTQHPQQQIINTNIITVYPQTIVMIILSLILMLLPWDRLLDIFFAEKFNLSTETYQQVNYKFNQTYRTVDPMQRMLALDKFIQGQNRARRINQQKDQNHSKIHTFLEIRQYEDDYRRIDKQAARQMTREQSPNYYQDLSITIKLSQSVQPSIRQEV